MTRAQRRTRARKLAAARAALAAGDPRRVPTFDRQTIDVLAPLHAAPTVLVKIGTANEVQRIAPANPNRGKRHASDATARPFGFTSNERDRMRDGVSVNGERAAGRRGYAPLHVATVITHDRAGRRLPAERVSVTQGYTV